MIVSCGCCYSLTKPRPLIADRILFAREALFLSLKNNSFIGLVSWFCGESESTAEIKSFAMDSSISFGSFVL